MGINGVCYLEMWWDHVEGRKGREKKPRRMCCYVRQHMVGNQEDGLKRCWKEKINISGRDYSDNCMGYEAGIIPVIMRNCFQDEVSFTALKVRITLLRSPNVKSEENRKKKQTLKTDLYYADRIWKEFLLMSMCTMPSILLLPDTCQTCIFSSNLHSISFKVHSTIFLLSEFMQL